MPDSKSISIDSPAQSTLEMQMMYYKILRFFGTLPLDIKTHIGKSNLEVNISQGRYFKWCSVITIFQIVSNTSFQIIQSIHYLFFRPEKKYFYLPTTGCAIVGINALVSFRTINQKLPQISSLLQDWCYLENSIYSDGNDVFPQEQRQKPHTITQATTEQHFHSKTALTFSIMAIVGIFFLIVNFSINPRYPPYYYSWVDVSIEIPVLKYASFILQSHSNFLMLTSLVQFDVIAFSFARSLIAVLDNISLKAKAKADWRGLEFALEKYGCLRHLIDCFNFVFGWLIFNMKGLGVIQICMFIFVPLRFMHLEHHAALLVFYCLVVVLLIRLCLVIPMLGSLREASVRFIESWNPILYAPDASVDVNLRMKLKSLTTLGFQCGTFYQIGPTSILTYLSIVVTYLVVLLQL